MKKYLNSYPDLIREWHLKKNGALSPDNVTYGSKKKYGGYVQKVMNGKLRHNLVQHVKLAALIVQETRFQNRIAFQLIVLN